MKVQIDTWGHAVEGNSTFWIRVEPYPELRGGMVLYKQGARPAAGELIENFQPWFANEKEAGLFLERKNWVIEWYPDAIRPVSPIERPWFGGDADFVLLALASDKSNKPGRPAAIRLWFDYINHAGMSNFQVHHWLRRLEEIGFAQRVGKKWRLNTLATKLLDPIPFERLGDLANACRDMLGMPHSDWPLNSGPRRRSNSANEWMDQPQAG